VRGDSNPAATFLLADQIDNQPADAVPWGLVSMEATMRTRFNSWATA